MSTDTAADTTAGTAARPRPSGLAAPPPAAAPAADYQPFAASSVIISEQLCEAVDLRAGWQVLDVATGTGNAALAAARRGCEVVGIDLVTEGLHRGVLRAAAEGLGVRYAAADATRLPFPDARFNAVLSTLGVIFACDQQAAANELLRVCRPGGRLGMANWTPDGWTASFFALLRRLTGPAGGAGASPFRWGSEAGLRELLGDRVRCLTATRRTFVSRHTSPQRFWAFLQATNGFVQARLDTLDPAASAQADREVLALLRRFNRADDGTAVIAHDYVQVTAVKAGTAAGAGA